MNLVFDSSALVAYLRGEDGAGVVERLLLSEDDIGYVHSINMCEVYYESWRAAGEERAQKATGLLLETGLIVREDMDEILWRQAGDIKADYKRFSLADCFCIALAMRLGCEIVTADRHEMGPLVAAGVCTARFIR